MKKGFWNSLMSFEKENRSTILVGIGISSMVGAMVGMYKAAPRAHEIVEKYKVAKIDIPKENKKERVVHNLKMVRDVGLALWKPIVFGSLSCGCFIGAHKVDQKKIAALTAIIKLTESQLADQKNKLAEVVGERKAREVQEKLAQDKVKESPMTEPITLAQGDVLCFDSLSKRYFSSNADKINQAILRTSLKLKDEMDITVNDFYYEIGLDEIPLAENIGWRNESHGKLPIRLTAVLTDAQEPCLCIEYDGLTQLVTYMNDPSWRR